MSILEKILRAGEGRMVRRLKAIADAVNSIEENYIDLTDDELRELTDQYRERFADGESLDDLLPEAFATAREAAHRVLGQRPLRRADHGRRRAALRQHRRDEDR